MIDVTRSDAPPALADGDLRDPEVLAALHRDFLGKCYLCESVVRPASFEVDHRVPKGIDPSQRYQWANLFPICEGCNKRRRKSYPARGLLDPASGDGDVARRLEQRILDRSGVPVKPYFVARVREDAAAVNTADELDHIHNDPGSSKAADLRATIIEHQRRVYCACARFLARRATLGEREVLEAEDYLRALLSRRAPFTALTRAELADLGPEITRLFD